jgi:hypothetical protein
LSERARFVYFEQISALPLILLFEKKFGLFIVVIVIIAVIIIA